MTYHILYHSRSTAPQISHSLQHIHSLCACLQLLQQSVQSQQGTCSTYSCTTVHQQWWMVSTSHRGRVCGVDVVKEMKERGRRRRDSAIWPVSKVVMVDC